MFNLILSSMNSERLESSERRFIVLANSNPLRANIFTSTINKAGAWFSSQCMSDLAWPGNKLNLLKMPSLSQHQALGALLISLFLPGPWTTISPSTRHQDVMIERRMNENCWEYVWCSVVPDGLLSKDFAFYNPSDVWENPCSYYINKFTTLQYFC